MLSSPFDASPGIQSIATRCTKAKSHGEQASEGADRRLLLERKMTLNF
jgi:hypothetical protein